MRHYWYQPEHKHICDGGCRELTAQDVIEMQIIDADCNDCVHFKRGELVTEIDGIYSRVKLGKAGKYFKGHCLKFDRPTTAHPGQYTGMPCFEHRRAIDMASAVNADSHVTTS